MHLRLIVLSLVVPTCYAARVAAAGSGVVPMAVPGAPSAVFELRVEGTSVPVIACKDIHFAQFSVARGCSIEVGVKDGRKVQSASVHPLRRKIATAIEGSRVRFRLPQRLKVVVQVDTLAKLFLFAEAPEKEPTGEGVVSAVACGARADGQTDSTSAVQGAIDALRAGGILYFPPGHYRTGTLRLRSDMTLYLAAGALVQAVDDHTKILPLPASPDMIGYVYAEDVRNLTIAGQGTIDANGYVVRKAHERAANKHKQAGRALAIIGSEGVTVSGVTVRDSYSWNIHAWNTEGLTVRDVKVLSDVRLSNHDGIDVDRCRNVLVEDCFFFTEDDAISPKARRGGQVVENLTFRNCVLWVHKANGIRIGTESDCRAMRHFLFEDLDILMANDGIRLDCAQGATYEDFTFRNVWIEGFLQFYDERFERNRERLPIDTSEAVVIQVSRGRGGSLGHVKNVLFENVHWSDPRAASQIKIPQADKRYADEQGLGPLVEDVVFRGCTRDEKPVLSAEDANLVFPEKYVKGLKFE